jgi:predicted enzyme related to lactoylglutathione lyase
MSLSIHTTVLPHDDPDASVAFYRDILGFEVRSDFGQGTMRWIVVGPADQPDVSILLATKDLDGTFERIQASDAEVVQEPTQQPYGARDCAFRDPAGNMLRFTQA